MAKSPMRDVVVILPGITGSVLQKDGKDVWAFSAGAAVRAALTLGTTSPGSRSRRIRRMWTTWATVSPPTG
ncbi:MAG TPA: hypothetical protein VEM93_01425 [Actinomycetota bacterium]|nr:hypothetical protein [Actinomycetota bacterium]